MGNEKTIQIKEIQDELFQKKGSGWFRIISGSMSPLIEINDRVFVKKVNPSEIKPRDIILFKGDYGFVTHRVIQSSEQNGKIMLLQKGDASNHASLIPPEVVMGKVMIIEKRGRFLNLTSYQGRVINGLLGWKNCVSYSVGIKIDPVKKWLKDKPEFIFIRGSYSALKKPFSYIHHIMFRIISSYFR
jgi:signal peptidase I